MGAYVVVWDGDCKLCARTVAILQRRASHEISFVTSQSLDEEHLAALGLTRLDTAAAMWLVSPDDPVPLAGYAAFRRVAEVSPRMHILRAMLRVPGAATIGPWIYERVARNRAHLGCTSTACSINSVKSIDSTDIVS